MHGIQRSLPTQNEPVDSLSISWEAATTRGEIQAAGGSSARLVPAENSLGSRLRRGPAGALYTVGFLEIHHHAHELRKR
jgi:hypothetical protein